MDLQTIPEAARTCGHSPREIRLMIEEGRLAAVRHAGRWLIDPLDLPGGQDPPLPPQAEPPPDRVVSLEAELRELRLQLEAAHSRIAELESASGFGRALRGSGERGALAPLFRPTTPG